MDNEFKQHHGLLKITANLLDDRVLLEEKDIFKSYKHDVPFADIPDSVTKFSPIPWIYIIVTLVFGILLVYRLYGYFTMQTITIGEVIWTVFLLLCSSYGIWMRSVRYIGFVCPGNKRLLFFDKEGIYNPKSFIKMIQEKKATNLKRKK